VNAIATLPTGTYTGQVVVTSQSANMSITIPVTLTVEPAGVPFFDNVPGQLSFSVVTHGSVITDQEIQVRNGGAGMLDWTVAGSTSDGGNWLTISSLGATAPSFVTIGVSVPNLPNAGLIAGTFVGQLVFQSSTGSVTVPIVVVVGDNVFSQVNGITFTKVFGGADPLPQTITIPSTGTAFNFSIAASTSTGGAWLSASTVTGCGLCSTPHSIVAIVNASPTLAVGTYTGQIVLTSQSANMSITVPVTLTVSDANVPFFDNLPGQMSFSLKTGGSTITSQSIQVRNAGTGTLNWTLSTSTSDAHDWLSVSTVAGTAPSMVSVSILKQNLPNQGLIAGTFIGELVFHTSGSSITVPVSVVVGDNIFSQVNAINFTKPFGTPNPLPQILAIPSTGTAFQL